MTPETKGCDVTEFYRRMEALGIEIWIDGGWGVDGLAGKQTRAHVDLDIVLQQKDLASAIAFESRGFHELPREDSRPWNFVMGNGKDQEIDVHVIVFDEEGNGLYGPPECGDGIYQADALQAKGTLNGMPVRCISAEFQIRSHRGYEFSDADVKSSAWTYRKNIGVLPTVGPREPSLVGAAAQLRFEDDLELDVVGVGEEDRVIPWRVVVLCRRI